MYISMLATQQSSPTTATEKGMRNLLRFLLSDADVSLALPSFENLGSQDTDDVKVISYSDASHAPYKWTNRK